MSNHKNIVYLYSEVMPYAITIMRALRDNFNANIDCICWDEKKLTPFVPVDMERIKFHRRSEFDKQRLIDFIEERNPGIIFISGRMDHGYLSVIKRFRSKGIPVISACDNQWYGTIKNRLAALFSKYVYHRYFEYIWVPGRRQFEFAKRVGFSNNNILGYSLSADIECFRQGYVERKRIHGDKFPKTIVFVGRFVKAKGIDVLVKAFTEFKRSTQSEWKLVMVGTGPLQIESGADIKVRDFMSTEMLARESAQWGVFCLPSVWEPWGVVMHEFTAAGMPVIASDGVGAADTFVVEGFNGYTFKPGNVDALKAAFMKLHSKSDDELWAMGQRSVELSDAITPVKAAHSFMSVLDKQR